MAGEIQVNSVTALTESGSNIVLNNVDTATNRTNLGLGSMATQNANAVALTGGSITGTEIDLKSTGTSVYKSDGTTAVISESSGTATINNATLGSSVVFPSSTIQRTSFVENTSQVSLTSAGPSTIVTGTIETDASYASDYIIALATINGQIYGNNSTTTPAGKYDIYDSTGASVKEEYAINAEFNANTRYITSGHSISARFTPASQNASYTVLVRIKDVTGFLNSQKCQLYLFYIKG